MDEKTVTLVKLSLPAVDAPLNHRLGKKSLRLPEAIQIAVYESGKLLQLANIDVDAPLGSRWGVYVDAPYSHIENTYQLMKEAYDSSPAYISPMKFPSSVLNSMSGWLSVAYGITGPNSTIFNGFTGGSGAFDLAVKNIDAGRLDYALVVYLKEYTPYILENITIEQHRLHFEEEMTILILQSPHVNSKEA